MPTNLKLKTMNSKQKLVIETLKHLKDGFKEVAYQKEILKIQVKNLQLKEYEELKENSIFNELLSDIDKLEQVIEEL